jgi:integrase
MSSQPVKVSAKARKPERISAIAPQKLHWLRDLAEAIKCLPSDSAHPVGMLRALIAHICMCLAKPPKEIAISELTGLRYRLSAHLQKNQNLRPKSIRSYVNYLRILLNLARQLGWREHSPEMEKAWKPILACVSCVKGPSIIHYAMRQKKTPATFSDDDLENWAVEHRLQGRGLEYTQHLKARFRRCILEAGLKGLMPKLTFQVQKKYAVSLSDFPEPLRSQWLSVEEWKTAAWVEGRPTKARLRPQTAIEVRHRIERLYGFVHTVLKKNIDSLTDLITKDNVTSYVKSCLNERKLCVPTMASWLGSVAALGKHPLFGGNGFSWAKDLMATLPVEVEGRIELRKARKFVDYDELSKVPGRILEYARRSVEPKRRASLYRDALMVLWLLVLPWRQKNLRKCRIGGPNPNLFKAEVSPMSMLAKPKWVEEELKTKPHQEFWQFRFGPDETKNGHLVQAFVPKQLVEPLEEYLANYRPLLVNGSDPGVLFLNDHGRGYSICRITITIGRLTNRYARRRVTPHLFRDIFAYKYLEERPEDYLTLSKILWHRDIETTLRIYGARFDESHGVRRLEEWLEERRKNR